MTVFLTILAVTGLSGLVGVTLAWGALSLFFRTLERHSAQPATVSVTVDRLGVR